ncbi:MAG: cell division protein FtsZ [Rickettsiales bacterium TMED269]|nr:cell division protein FtsZ [Gammaproteobacteria bacterium]OUX40625.1 MAG: cell division protein FtsZ [Rickettsiales bacterium TMED269]
MSEFAFELMDTDSQRANIKVIGIGGGGGNAVNHMIKQGIQGVKFICANTDTQDLSSSPAEEKIQLGVETSKGLGAGMNPEIGRASAEEAGESIRALLSDTNMLFITAGFGGGTGTGASPVIAKIAKEMDILTVGVVTKPFEWEGEERSALAEEGLQDLEQHVDSLIVIPNDRLQSLGERITLFNAFQAANEVLLNSVQGIVELVTVPGVINLDFADVKAVMGKKGRSIMGSSIASGPDRARLAIEQAINSPLLEDISLDGASGILLNVTVANDIEVSEFNQIGAILKSYTKNKAKVIAGTSLSRDLEDDSIRVTLVATGLNTEKSNKNKEENRERSFDDLDRPITARNGLRQQKTQDMFESFQKTTSSGDQDEELLDIPRFLKRQEKQDPEKRQEKQDPDLDF